MPTISLEDFIGANREEIIGRCRAKVSTRSLPQDARAEEAHGVPRLLDQVVEELRHGPSVTDDITETAARQGHALLREGFSIGQVVHGYGDVCQSVTEMAVELGAPISADDFRTLNRCLDDAIAGAVTEHSRGQAAQADVQDEGSLELGNLAEIALVAFEALERGNVGVGGSTGRVLRRSLETIRTLAVTRSPTVS